MAQKEKAQLPTRATILNSDAGSKANGKQEERSEDLPEDWPEDWPEDLPEDLEEIDDEEKPEEYLPEDGEYEEEYDGELETEEDGDRDEKGIATSRVRAGIRPSIVSSAAIAPPKGGDSFELGKGGVDTHKKKTAPRKKTTGLKKGSLKKAKQLDMPPTPLGCEWREAEDGWTLWRCWSERDQVIGGRYKKERYAGHLSREAWSVMKEYDYETFISIIGQRFRRYGGR